MELAFEYHVLPPFVLLCPDAFLESRLFFHAVVPGLLAVGDSCCFVGFALGGGSSSVLLTLAEIGGTGRELPLASCFILQCGFIAGLAFPQVVVALGGLFVASRVLSLALRRTLVLAVDQLPLQLGFFFSVSAPRSPFAGVERSPVADSVSVKSLQSAAEIPSRCCTSKF